MPINLYELLQEHKLISTSDACELLGVSKPTLSKFRDEGMPHYLIRGFYLGYDAEQIKKWAAEKNKPEIIKSEA